MTIYKNKYVKVVKFTNDYKDKMFYIQFITSSDSDNSYRGFKIEKAKEVSKFLREMAKKIESL